MESIDPVEARRLMEGGALLIDVREPDEWAAGHAPGALHRPPGGRTTGHLPDSAVLLLVCRSGARSARAQQELAAAGRDAINLAGSMNAWMAAGLPVVTDDEHPGR